ncbi:MAG: ATP-binding protein, partial [Acidimicrobiia bacterium]
AEQASSAKMGAALSAGAAIFGALLGRKTISAANIGRASSAARGVSKIGKESQDVTRATENVNALKDQLAQIEADMQADIQAVTADWEMANEPFERVLVKPKRGGISVQLVTLVWVPA